MNKFNFDKVIAKLEKQKKSLPKKLGNQAVIFFQSNFQRQGFLDSSRVAWPQRKRNKQSGRAILIKSGALRRDIRLKSANYHKIVISTSLPYAAIHNYGYSGTESIKPYRRALNIKKRISTGTFSIKTRRENKKTIKEQIGTTMVGAHSRNMRMPKRQFMGNSVYLNRQLMFLIQQDMDKLFR